jgi:hypothetical protein
MTLFYVFDDSIDKSKTSNSTYTGYIIFFCIIVLYYIIKFLYWFYCSRNTPASVGGVNNSARLLRLIATGSRSNVRNMRNIQLAMMDRDFTGEDYELLQSLDDDIDKSAIHGANDSEINRLPVHTLTENDIKSRTAENATCAICLEPFVVNDISKTISCLHVFHKACIDKWLHSNAICPICKFPAIV